MGCGTSKGRYVEKKGEQPGVLGGAAGRSPGSAGVGHAEDRQPAVAGYHQAPTNQQAVPEVLSLESEIDLGRQEKLSVCKEVYIFRHLSPHQLDLLVDAFKISKFQRGEQVIVQHEIGDSFFVVATGELQVIINGNYIRNLGKNAYFGERALLFDEPRTATVEVISLEVEAWAVDKATFLQIVKGKMQQQLMHRIRLQDTSVTLDDLKTMRRIGEGAAGAVDMVEHRKTRTRYALKQVKKEGGKLPQEVEREMDLLKMNDHPFVLQLVKTFETEELAYMLVELITGGELHAAIRTIPTVLSRSQAQFYVGSLALGLDGLHSRRIVYRDLKPENVMLDHQGYLKIIDFGIAKKLTSDKERTYTTVGTPHYMAPEVMRGRGYGFAVDDWSLGVVLFELVCGYLPFANDLDSAQDVCMEVIRGKLEIPAWYKDKEGAELLRGLICPDWKRRLGAGGFEEIKSAAWFANARNTSTGTHLFDQLMGRELDAPVVPNGETFAIDAEENMGL